jgi:delta8-fatty-acid desaturase
MDNPPALTGAARGVLSRREIEGMIADGQLIIILGTNVLRLDPWINRHPGGDLAIKHMVGRDATDEVNAYVLFPSMPGVANNRRLHSPKALRAMRAYQIGSVENRWVNFIPPIQGGRFTPYSYIDEDIEDVGSDISSELSSSPPSTIFETARGQYGLRRCHSTSTTSSSSSPGPEQESVMPHFCVLDARTQLEIALDKAQYPPLDADHQHSITLKYRALNKRIQAEGLYDCNYSAYAVEALRYSILFALFLFCILHSHFALAGLFLGCFWHQLVFTAHDAGHMGITHDFTTDTAIGIIVADFIGGLSLGWWKRSHNVHHIMTNSPEHDPDIELMPFFAVSHRFFTDLHSTYYNQLMEFDFVAQCVIKYQHYLYYPILLFGRFNLYFLSYAHIFSGLHPRNKKQGPLWPRYLELAGQIFFWSWFGYGICYRSIPTWTSRVLFILISHCVTAPLHVQITLSHYGMSTVDLGVTESFAQKMLRTTMDVDCPVWLDFVHGGLQFQAIHHLYPRIPRHNLRRTQGLVREFCKDVAIPYAIFTFVDGNKKVLGRLGDVARQARIFEEGRREAAAVLGGNHHHHHEHSH